MNRPVRLQPFALLMALTACGFWGSSVAIEARAEEHRGAVRCAETARLSQVRTFDALQGADPTNYPPDSPVDVVHLALDLHFDALMSKQFRGTSTLILRPKREGLTAIRLDAVELAVGKIDAFRTGFSAEAVISPADLPISLGQPLTIKGTYFDDRVLWIEFAEALPLDVLSAIRVEYTCTDPRFGVVYALPQGSPPSHPLTLYSQGQSEFARYWFPCTDSLVDRFTSSTTVEIPAGLQALSNGRLLATTTDPDLHTTTFNWFQSVPHVAYLVSLVVGDFDIIEDHWRTIPVQYYVPNGRRGDGELTFRRTPEMIEYFSQLLGFDYPYAKYAQAAVFRFPWEGMENISATTLTDSMLIDQASTPDHDNDELISHELAHQWFGDWVTCRSWSDLWLNEGFATFMERVWMENAQGHDTYLAKMAAKMEEVAAADGSEKGVPLVFRDYDDPEITFVVQGDLPYEKGALVLHMIRHQLGDEIFWRCIHRYLDQNRNGLVESADLRRAIEQVSGQDWENFFNQWVYRPGSPDMHISTAWHGDDSTFEVTVEQKQIVLPGRPAFVFPLDAYLRCDSQTVERTLECNAKLNKFRIPLPSEPLLYEFDPASGLLATIHAEKPSAMLSLQLQEGPTIVSKIRAAKQLANEKGDEVIETLTKILNDTVQPRELRQAVADSLAEMDTDGSWSRLRNALIVGDGIADSHVRETVVALLADHGDETEIADLMKTLSESDPSVRVKAAALHALAKVRDDRAGAILLKCVDENSFEDKIRIAALDGIASQGLADGLDAAMKYATLGQHDRLRPTAIQTVGTLGLNKPLRDSARNFLINLLEDPEPEAVQAAIRALATLDDPKSRQALERFRSAVLTPETKAELEAQLAAMDGKPASEGETSDLQDLANDLSKDLNELTDRLRT